MKRKIGAAVLILIALVAVGTAPSAEAQGGCSSANLNGAYAVSRQGTLLTSVLGLPAPAPWDEVALAHFNGTGSFFGTATVNIGGIVLSATFTGTYTIYPDCTGVLTVHPNVPVTITESIIVIKGGQAYIATDTESFAVVHGRGEKLDD